MTMRMLIDARHPEETRVAVVKGNRIEEFDFESAEHKQLKGNIYLAKVTRVEPSLQAAFVDYGGNRHGFLAFSEIHPDYYQIPREDREALLREEAEHAAEEERLRNQADDLEPIDSHHEDDGTDDRPDDYDDEDENGDDSDEPVQSEETGGNGRRSVVDEADELRRKRQNLRRRYKIQDVIHRRQVLLVQVVKEERGNKGAALTTYLSLAGRYCVLMPNTSHGGGISRKISNGADRKRLKSIMAELKLPSTMGLIVRTAGLQRTKTEIKRDFDYLARLWDEVRENTLKSSAPALIYRDSDLVKRAIRDLYHREIEEVIVEGEDGFRAARGYMKLLMPSHVRRVTAHTEATSLFQRYGVEDQLGAMYQPIVQLKSGGYLVINPTEALVSIDINSGRSTREHNIEQTAFQTNLEAANEIARQLRLRDMAGLVVIDFIDMEQNSHVRKVEKAMKEALKNDRARIQVGRISSFGLMEMSRQRLRTGVLEASTKACPHCEGTGLMRTASSAGLQALRLLEEEAARGRGEKVCLRAGAEAAIYVLNKKRTELADIEARYGVSVEVLVDPSFEGARMMVESSGPRPIAPPRPQPLPAPIMDDVDDAEFDDVEEEDGEDFEDEADASAESEDRGEGDHGEGGKRRRRRRRRGGRNRRREGDAVEGADAGEEAAAEGSDELVEAEAAEAEAGDAGEEEQSRRGRRRRNGRRRREGDEVLTADEQQAPETPVDLPAPDEAPMKEPVPSEDPSPDTVEAPAEPAPVGDEKPKARRRPRARKADAAAPLAEVAPEAPADVAAQEAAAAPEKPKRRSRKKAEPVAAEQVAEAPALVAEPAPEQAGDTAPELALEPVAEPAPEVAPEASNDTAPEAAPAAEPVSEEPQAPRRQGWWQRTFG
ncbi:Rne/Rng family ribonuclease [Sphingomonas sp. BN140010]|uniref:Ribonuclease E n=1 Tax=Sphingomonas arvum TaxID=2992113 RepID=A0ABT3JGR3_9SPHN|nr:ribonuclease E/G [Sphingomonas sp. BN140010]MCW3798272.1 Rne/Rng family ribonuclease [Sphingomonas sp. BN140010]